MNLISCEGCGAVLDTGRIPEPGIYNDDGDDEGCINKGTALWHNREYVPAFNCPVCKALISYKTGDT